MSYLLVWIFTYTRHCQVNNSNELKIQYRMYIILLIIIIYCT